MHISRFHLQQGRAARTGSKNEVEQRLGSEEGAAAVLAALKDGAVKGDVNNYEDSVHLFIVSAELCAGV
jgi:hypothetical protein